MNETTYPDRVTLKRMDNIGIVVEDLEATIAFFTEIGMELEGKATVTEQWAARISGVDDVHVDVAMMRTPDGHNRLELMRYHTPTAIAGDPNAPMNTVGMYRLLFAVDDIEAVVARLRARGAELLGEIGRIGDSYLMCYLRGPGGLILALAEELT